MYLKNLCVFRKTHSDFMKCSVLIKILNYDNLPICINFMSNIFGEIH